MDAARVLRVPGSIHRTARQRVSYVIQADEYGRGFVYTLPEMAAALDLPTLEGDLPEKTRSLAKSAQYRKVKNPGSTPLRSHGMRKLNALRAQDLLTLQTYRGGFLKRGMKYPDDSTSRGRRFVLTLYLNFLRGAGEDQTAVLNALQSMAANCKPPYPSDPPSDDPPLQNIMQAEYSTKSRRRWSNATLCPILGISADLAGELDLKTIRPDAVALDADRDRPHQADVIQARILISFDI